MPNGHTRILLVDDEPALLEVCAETLSGPDVDIDRAGDGAAALALLKRRSYDLIVSDLRMPGMGGVELLREVGRLAADTDVIVLTGYGTIDSAVECVRLGAVNYLLKPFKVDELRAAVAKALDERALRPSRNGVEGISHMLALNTALSGQREAKAVVKEFLTQIHAAFAPSGIAFFVHGAWDFGLGSHVLIGPYFRENPGVRSWFESLARSIAAKDRPMLLEEGLLREAFGASFNGRVPVSAIGAAVGGPRGQGNPDCPKGAVVALRAGKAAPYTLEELKLFTLFTSHASLCFESRHATARLKSVNDEIVFSLVHAVEAKDTYTRGHSERVSRYVGKLAAHMGLSNAEAELARAAAMLHDIGKIGVPDHILTKPGPLTADELPAMRQHPAIARTILDKVESLSGVVPLVYHHHEHFDGSGYPDGLSGDNIPPLARLISVADGFEAMTSDRSYHKASSVQEARETLSRGAGTQWDPRIVRAWLEVLDTPSS